MQREEARVCQSSNRTQGFGIGVWSKNLLMALAVLLIGCRDQSKLPEDDQSKPKIKSIEIAKLEALGLSPAYFGLQILGAGDGFPNTSLVSYSTQQEAVVFLNDTILNVISASDNSPRIKAQTTIPTRMFRGRSLSIETKNSTINVFSMSSFLDGLQRGGGLEIWRYDYDLKLLDTAQFAFVASPGYRYYSAFDREDSVVLQVVEHARYFVAKPDTSYVVDGIFSLKAGLPIEFSYSSGGIRIGNQDIAIADASDSRLQFSPFRMGGIVFEYPIDPKSMPVRMFVLTEGSSPLLEEIAISGKRIRVFEDGIMYLSGENFVIREL